MLYVWSPQTAPDLGNAKEGEMSAFSVLYGNKVFEELSVRSNIKKI
jgi:hypothetical protein